MMLFNSFSFLLFFAAVVLVYYLIDHRYRWVLLLASSLYFYATFNLEYVALLMVSTIVIYFAGVLMAAALTPAKKRALPP